MFFDNRREVPAGTLPFRRPLCLFCCLILALITIARFAGLKTSAQMAQEKLEEAIGEKTDVQVFLTGRIESASVSEYGTRLTVGQISGLCRTDEAYSPGAGGLSDIMGKEDDGSGIIPEVGGGVQFYVYTEEISPEDLQPGEWVAARGTLERIDGPTNPGQFDYRLWCRNRGIIMSLKDSRITHTGSVTDTVSILADISARMKRSLQSVLNAEDAGVIASMLLGDRSGLSREIRSLYQDGGIAHILAISALHINLLGMTLYRLLRKRRCSFRLSALLSCLFVFLFCEMTGMSMTSARAMILFILWCASQVLGRTNDLPTSLSMAAALIMLRQPGYMEESSFWLSFGCVLSLYFLSEPLTDLLYRPLFHRKPGSVGNACLSSLAVWVGTAPITCWFFYRITPWSVPGNLAVLPLMSFLMVSAMAGSLAGMVSTEIGIFIAAPCHYILAWFKMLCSFMRMLPGGVVITGRPQGWQVILYYTGMTLFVIMMRARRKQRAVPDAAFAGKNRVKPVFPRRLRSVAASIALCLSVVSLLCKAPLRDRVVFLDVGQGDSILVMCGHFRCLVDCGSSSTERIWDQAVSETLQYYGIDTLDAVFLTHGDSDHVNGISQLLASYQYNMAGRNAADVSVGQLLVPEAALETDEVLRGMLETAGQAGIRTTAVRAGDSWQIGDLSVTCLYPEPDDAGEDTNQNSLVLQFRRADVTVLLTGDLEKEGEEALAQRMKENWKRPEGELILKVGHHGSRYASSETFLNIIRPDIAVISCGRYNRYGHPAQVTLYRLWKAGAKVRRTDQEGAVILWI